MDATVPVIMVTAADDHAHPGNARDGATATLVKPVEDHRLRRLSPTPWRAPVSTTAQPLRAHDEGRVRLVPAGGKAGRSSVRRILRHECSRRGSGEAHAVLLLAKLRRSLEGGGSPSSGGARRVRPQLRLYLA